MEENSDELEEDGEEEDEGDNTAGRLTWFYQNYLYKIYMISVGNDKSYPILSYLQVRYSITAAYIVSNIRR